MYLINCCSRTFWRLKIRDWFRANINVTQPKLRQKRLTDRLRVSRHPQPCLRLICLTRGRRTFEDYARQERVQLTQCAGCSRMRTQGGENCAARLFLWVRLLTLVYVHLSTVHAAE